MRLRRTRLSRKNALFIAWLARLNGMIVSCCLAVEMTVWRRVMFSNSVSKSTNVRALSNPSFSVFLKWRTFDDLVESL